ncbi:MAG: acyl-CoA dehydrogenase [Candidatus Cloacimonadota bacterium]|nr:MAG: acyl-CoA dehydrogenase [Candidatus Cloacimonadota bacterium]
MDFNLSEDQKLIRDMSREFAEKELKDYAVEIDEKREFPKNVLKKMSQLGLLGLAIPEKFSGNEMDILSIVIAIEEIAKVCASTAVICAIHNLVVSYAISQFGTEEQKRKHLPKLAQGKEISGISLMEPDAESLITDLDLITSQQGEKYILNGKKRLMLGGNTADLFLVFAKDEQSKIKIFLIEKGMDGFIFDKEENTLGLRGIKSCELSFEKCQIPKENLLGKDMEQTLYLKKISDMGKIAISAVAIGIAQSALDMSIEYSLQRRQFGKTIAEFQAIQWMLAQMESDITGARSTLYYAVALKGESKSTGKECAIAKLTSAQVAVKTTINAIQVRGGYGYMKDFPLERMFRDAKSMEFIMGTLQTQKDIIAEKLLKS